MQSLEPSWELDSDLEIRMSEFESRLHEVEAANLQQNSTWFSKFQAMEIKIAQIQRHIVELPQPDAVQGGRQIAELRAAVNALSKTCAADKLEIKASIEASARQSSEGQEDTQRKLAQISSHESKAATDAARVVEQLQATVQQMQLESSRAEQKHTETQQRLEKEIKDVASKCDKRAAVCREEHEAAVSAAAAETEIADTIADATESLELKLVELEERINAAEASNKQQLVQSSTSFSSKLSHLEQQLAQTLTQKLKADMAQMLAHHKCNHGPPANTKSPRGAVTTVPSKVAKQPEASRFPHVRSVAESGSNVGSGRRGSVKTSDGLNVGNGRGTGEVGVQGVVPRVKHVVY